MARTDLNLTAACTAALAAALAMALAAALAACAGSPRLLPDAAGGTAAAASDSPPAAERAPVDASFDWRNLPLAPLGTPYRSLHSLVHEVLLFRDTAPQADSDSDTGQESERPQDSVRPEARDCYAPNDAAPRFIGRPTERYLLCFRDDRLSRVQAVVRFDAVEDAPAKLFATLCADWLAGAAPDVQSATRCAGRDDNRAFSAELGSAALADAATLDIVVYDVSVP